MKKYKGCVEMRREKNGGDKDVKIFKIYISQKRLYNIYKDHINKLIVCKESRIMGFRENMQDDFKRRWTFQIFDTEYSVIWS